MKKLLTVALTALCSTAALADEPAKTFSQCVTRTVEAPFSGATWMKQTVCKDNEVAISGSGFCTGSGPMIGASTTNAKIDRDVWLQCAKSGPAIWYATCCQQTAVPPPLPPKTLKQCVTRSMTDKFSGSTWVAKEVCQANEVAISGGGFCSKAGQLVGASTTNNASDRKVWLQCSAAGEAMWYGVCCQTTN